MYREVAGFDQSVDGPKVHLEVFQDFFGRQEDFVGREIQRQDPVILPPCPDMAA